MLAQDYFDVCLRVLERIRDEQMDKVQEAARIIAEAIAGGNSFFAFGCTHSSLPIQEVFYRAGGFMLINPIFAPGLTLDVRPPTMTSRLERLDGYGRLIFENVPAREGDVLLLISVSGRNAVPLEVALEAKRRGMKLVVITALEYTQNVESRHASGKKVYELADLVLDNYSPRGDAVLELEGLPQKTGSTSGVAASCMMHAIVSQVVENLMAEGITPPVYMSGNLDGGAEYNERMLAKYKDRIFYT
ncbi:MAG: hypothetical protein CVU38_01775 [Chloroflexi bacterium HGW-Chloroflexi-1]|nr:MAG: hypothetical protein CVU38_01775 [Chloroflexi bacterium HGW-Chloroflexi-1]